MLSTIKVNFEVASLLNHKKFRMDDPETASSYSCIQILHFCLGNFVQLNKNLKINVLHYFPYLFTTIYVCSNGTTPIQPDPLAHSFV